MEPDFEAVGALEPPLLERCSVAALEDCGSCILDFIRFASAENQKRPAFYSGMDEDALERLNYGGLLTFA